MLGLQSRGRNGVATRRSDAMTSRLEGRVAFITGTTVSVDAGLVVK